jgi:hypothetical protein
MHCVPACVCTAVLASSLLDFSYRDPERGWDRSRVKGVSAAGAGCLLAVADNCYVAITVVFWTRPLTETLSAAGTATG